jgi:hypothetical protein
MRRTLALAGAAVLAIGISALPAPATADPIVGDVVVSEVAANLVDAGPNSNIDGDFVELFNDSSDPVDVGGWAVLGCNPTSGDFEITTIPTGTTIPAGAKYLIADIQYGLGGGPTANRTFDSGADLVQSAGGVLLQDSSAAVKDDVKYGNPSSQLDCSAFTASPVSPDNDESINRHPSSGWSSAFKGTPTPEPMN